MSRSTMAAIILRLRGMTQAGTADYTVAGVSYWTDDHLQDVLDRYRVDVMREQIDPLDSYDSGNIVYKDYYSVYDCYESTDGGTAIFELEDGLGNTIGTVNYTPDYQRGYISFVVDTDGATYYLSGRSYDINAAAADVWRQKAAQYALSVDFSTDNHSIRRGAIVKQCMEMSALYERQQRPKTVTLLRSDHDWTD